MRKVLSLAVVLAMTLGALPSAAFAQGEAESLEMLMMKEASITVASTRPETVFNSVSNVTVIDRQTIERFNYTSVREAIESVAGIMVWRTYFFKRLTTFRGGLQEQYANKNLIMINNVPMWHAVTGEGDPDRIPIEAVERIEILRGPASVLYGSNALNGAINIVLRKAKKGETMGQMVAGVGTTHRRWEGDLEATRGIGQVSSTGEDYSYNVIGSQVAESWPLYNFHDEHGVNTQIPDRDRIRSFTATGQWKGHSILAQAASSDDGFMGVTPRRSGGAGNDHSREFGLLNYQYAFGPQLWNLKYSITYDRQRRNFSRADDDNTRTDTVGSRVNNTLSANIALADQWNLELGADHDYRHSYRYNTYNPLTQTVNVTATQPNENELKGRSVYETSGFAQLGYDANPWRAVVGSRYTYNQIFGSDFSSRGSVVYQLNDTNSVKAVVGQAYRAPTLFELYFLTKPMSTGGVVGNPDLDPEKVTSAELSYLTSWGSLFGQITGYWAEHKKRIFRTVGAFTRDGATANVNFYKNGATYNAKGVEAELRYRAPKTEAYVAVDYIAGSKGDNTPVTDAFNSAVTRDSYNYKYVPNWTLSSGLSQSVGNWFASANGNVYAPMHAIRERIKSQAWADAAVGWKNGRIRHAVGVKNVTGTPVQIPEYVRNTAVQEVTMFKGRRVEYTFAYQF